MSVKVNVAGCCNEPVWALNEDGMHVLQKPYMLSMDMVMQDGKKCIIDVNFFEGFCCDGLSVPWIFRWFLKSWDENNYLYNLAGALHDWLYATEGNDHTFEREECDDIFRGLLREAGKSRGKAGVADKAVEWFAGGKAHWNNDDFGIRDKAALTKRE